MALLVVAITPISMTHRWYDTEIADYLDDGYLTELGLETYSLFVFSQFTTQLFLNLSVACYLSVMLLFTSLTMMHINAIQDEVMTIVSANSSSFDLTRYLEAKGKIVSLKRGSYFSTQLLTFTAAINIISFMFMLWYFHYSFIKSTSSSSDDDDAYADDAYVGHLTYTGMIIYDFYLFPYLLKGSIMTLLLLSSSSL
jgi:hypothetical protein